MRALAKTGASVHFVGRHKERGQQIEAELGAGRGRFIPLDLSRLRDTRDFARTFAAEVDTLDVLVNAAGVMLPTFQRTDEGFEKTFAVDCLSAYILCEELAPSLSQANRGRIANVSAPPAQMLKPRLNFDDLQRENKYSLIEAVTNALHAKTVMTEILSDRLAPRGIDVNAFHAGAVRSNLGRHMKFPLRTIFGFAQLFMPRESKAGIYTSTADELNGVTGQLIVGTKYQPLQFEQDYKDRLHQALENMTAEALPAATAA